MRWSWIALCLAMACGGGDLNVEEAANTAMSAGDFGVAMDKASTGIESARASGDRAAVWRLEMIVLEAMARSGQGALVVAELERLSADYAKQVNAKLYLSLGVMPRPLETPMVPSNCGRLEIKNILQRARCLSVRLKHCSLRVHSIQRSSKS